MKENLPQPELHTPHKPDSTVRDLVLQAQAGSREAYLALTARYRPLLESSVARFGASEMTDQERRDLREEAERVFLGAISSYDTDQDAVDFGLYAKICLRNGLVSEWRHLQALRRVVSVPMEEELSPDLTVPDPAQELEEEERFSKLCRTVREQLSDYENQVWWQYVTGVSVSDIAEGLGRDERSVHNAIYRIRKKLREKITPTEE